MSVEHLSNNKARSTRFPRGIFMDCATNSGKNRGLREARVRIVTPADNPIDGINQNIQFLVRSRLCFPQLVDVRRYSLDGIEASSSNKDKAANRLIMLVALLRRIFQNIFDPGQSFFWSHWRHTLRVEVSKVQITGRFWHRP